jgi:hypothetical protein
MKSPAKKTSKSARFFSALIRGAYLPAELPPAFTSASFAEFCSKNFDLLKSQQSVLGKTATEYETFTAPRTKSGRRNLAIVHPLAQMNVSLLLTEHRQKIKKVVGRSHTSLYRTDDDLDRSIAFKGLDFAKRRELQSRVYSECRFILSADISRFFYTLYTHSIPWAVIGKEKAKDWLANSRKKLDQHWSSQIDRAMQLCQSRETFGIPVGPDTSRLIAELLLAGIEGDKRLATSLANGFAFRLVDDFTIGFEEEGDAHEALAALRHALWKFNLQLNEDKTSIKSSRNVMRARWELEHESYEISDEDTKLQAIQIARLIELTFHFCSDSGSDTPALWTCRQISQLKNIKENFGLVLDGSFRISREFPRCISYVATTVINNQDFCINQTTKARIERWCKATIKEHVRHGHDFEVAWSLVVCGALNIPIKSNDIGTLRQMPRPTTMALIGLLQEKGMSTVALSNWNWRAELKRSGILGPYWLPFYEAVLRGWTGDKNLVNKVTADPFLSKMLAAKVTFLDDRIFEAAQIKLPRRASTGARASIRTTSGIASYRAAKKSQVLGGGFAKARIILADWDY